MSRKMCSSSGVFGPVLEQELENNEVFVFTFHSGGMCVGLRHNYAGQRLSEGAVVERQTGARLLWRKTSLVQTKNTLWPA